MITAPVVEAATGAQTVIDRRLQHGEPLALPSSSQANRAHHVLVPLRRARQQPPSDPIIEPRDHLIDRLDFVRSLDRHQLDGRGHPG